MSCRVSSSVGGCTGPMRAKRERCSSSSMDCKSPLRVTSWFRGILLPRSFNRVGSCASARRHLASLSCTSSPPSASCSPSSSSHWVLDTESFDSPSLAGVIGTQPEGFGRRVSASSFAFGSGFSSGCSRSLSCCLDCSLGRSKRSKMSLSGRILVSCGSISSRSLKGCRRRGCGRRSCLRTGTSRSAVSASSTSRSRPKLVALLGRRKGRESTGLGSTGLPSCGSHLGSDVVLRADLWTAASVSSQFASSGLLQELHGVVVERLGGSKAP
mmetsp:Transcript_6875/g.16303  ORF Transcript_6875/g.16303 Transcript_6875/m.16303 type:complete len:270 (-) Transcript_6875:213-1022(-)